MQIATSPGLVFVLDSGRKSVYSVTPNATSNPGLVVQAGETDSGFTIGVPRQLATAGATALVLDDHSVLVRASGASKTATSLTAGAQNLKVAAIANTGADVYLLDTGSGQLWRYQYGVAGFNPPPQAFFTSNKPDLTHAKSLAFDSSSLYVLSTSGLVRKFDINTANPQPFTVHARTPLRAPSAVFTDVGLNNVWIADPSTGRIVQLDKSGNYQRTYMSGAASMDLEQDRQHRRWTGREHAVCPFRLQAVRLSRRSLAPVTLDFRVLHAGRCVTGTRGIAHDRPRIFRNAGLHAGRHSGDGQDAHAR